jgi:hypothetical protein
MLRHASVNTTLDLYHHVSEELQRRTAAVVNGAHIDVEGDNIGIGEEAISP